MERIETVVDIQKPISQVFAYLSAPANLAEWAPGYVEARLTSNGPIGVGSTVERVTDFGGRRSTSHATVRGFEPDARISFATQSGPLEIVEIFEVQAVEGGTRVTIAEEVRTSLLLKPLEWIFARMAGKNIDQYGVALKHQLDNPDDPM